MDITPLGIVLIPFGIVLFLLGPKYLMWALIISAPFFDTSIVQIHFWTTAIRPYFYFGGLLLLRNTLDTMISGHSRLNLSSSETRWLLIFCLMIGLSLFMPILLEGKVRVLPIEIGPGRSSFEVARIHGIESVLVPLGLGRINFTQALYPVFMAFLFLALVSQIETPKQLYKILKINVGLGVFVVLTGIFYQISFSSGNIALVDRIYALVTGKAEIRRHSLAFGALPHMYSVAGEAGFTGAFLLFVMGQVAAPILMKRTSLLWGKRISMIIFIFLFLGLLLTGGTTGYIGIIFFFGALLFLPYFRKRKQKGLSRFGIILRVFMIAAGLFFLVYLLLSFFGLSLIDYVRHKHLDKLLIKSGSGAIRYDTAMYGLRLFIRYPLLGVGIGSNRTLAVISSLLSNIGLLGTIPFLLFNWIVFRKGMKVYRKSKNPNLAVITLGCLISFVSLFGIMTFAKGMASLLFLYYWILPVMIISAFRFYKTEAAL